MTKIKEMYSVLEQMIESAANGDKEKVLSLHEKYKTLSPEVYPMLKEPLRFEYDNCRNSCVASVGILKQTDLSSLPGLNKAESIKSGLDVAAKT